MARLLSALWLGAGVFLLVVAPAVFGAAMNPTIAANVVGAMLTRWHYVALLAPLLLIVLEWRRARTIAIGILFASIVMATAQALVDVRIRAIRADSTIPITSLAPGDPVRRHFGMLHGISSLLLIGEVLAAAMVVMLDPPRVRLSALSS